MCPGNPIFTTATNYVNSFADILSTGVNSPTAQCDAISVGIGFRAQEATFSGVARSVKPLPGCPSDGGAGASGAGGTGGLDASAGASGPDASAGSAGTAGTAGTAGVDASAGTGGTAGLDAGTG